MSIGSVSIGFMSIGSVSIVHMWLIMFSAYELCIETDESLRKFIPHLSLALRQKQALEQTRTLFYLSIFFSS